MRLLDRLFIAIVLILLSIFLFRSELNANEIVARCSATTTGILDSRYTEETTKKYFVEVRKEYRVTYSFLVNGVGYQGRDLIKNAPKSSEATIFYNPANPAENFIDSRSLSPGVIVISLMFGLAGVTLLVFPMLRRKNASEICA